MNTAPFDHSTRPHPFLDRHSGVFRIAMSVGNSTEMEQQSPTVRLWDIVKNRCTALSTSVIFRYATSSHWSVPLHDSTFSVFCCGCSGLSATPWLLWNSFMTCSGRIRKIPLYLWSPLLRLIPCRSNPLHPVFFSDEGFSSAPSPLI